MNKLVRCVAATIRSARVEAPAGSVTSSSGQNMRAWIARDLAREFRGIYRDFEAREFFDLCDISPDQRLPQSLRQEWSGSPDPSDPDNFWIDDATGERVNAHGERSKR